MTDLILQIGATKLALSVALAALAWTAQCRVRRPALSHALWLLTLGALLMPPLISIPVFSPEAAGVASSATHTFRTVAPSPSPGGTAADWFASSGEWAVVWLWLSGAVGALGWTLARTLRFRRRLTLAAEVAPPEVQRLADEIGAALGLRRVPTIHTARADISPMVWWTFGPVRVLIPSTLLVALSTDELRCVLAHELAHVRRRDHVARWLEWAACTVFWWNPVAWWARRRVRAAEEFCTDALAVSSVKADPRAYAGSLLRAIDLISAHPESRPPAFASTAHAPRSGAKLEERFRMIMTKEPPTAPRWFRGALKGCAVCVLAAGLVYCTDRPETGSPDAALTPAGSEIEPTSDSPAESRRLAAALTSHIDSLAADGQLTRDAAESFTSAFVPRLAELGASISFEAGVPQEFDIRVRISGSDFDRRSEAVIGNLIGLQKALALANGLDPREMFVSSEGALGARTVHIRGFRTSARMSLAGPDECSVELHDRADVSRVSCDTWSEVSIPEFRLAASR
ncbi:M56 family metallopeptidase [Candidatus Palauibacter sp.]|uniref:M56 family metallopeptidase n=1 Tax=Candidatus Palauibacter sp. TaxID=3101350 RepID=UPI003B016A1E